MDDLIPPLSYAPDGLYETDVDALIVEYFTAHEPEPSSALVDRVAEHRHVRRVTRQTINGALRSGLAGTDDADAAA
ncbi:hypothetical protein [Amycolatopsis taiwanensis]|uniref:hypothetical protein n=1 Tax=Amycolatopsis taiwanensis TaxID=342230 RepID=UPI0004B47B41|nr:hypothetical protein [Amycolatopsis taiwanensis]